MEKLLFDQDLLRSCLAEEKPKDVRKMIGIGI